MQIKKCSIAISRGRFLRIGVAFYDESNKTAYYTALYDNYDMANLISLIKNCDEIFTEENEFLKFLFCENFTVKIIKLKNKTKKENVDFYANIALNILNENMTVEREMLYKLPYLNIYYDIDILGLWNEIFQEKNIKFNKKFNFEVLLLQPLTDEDAIKKRMNLVEYFRDNVNLLDIEENLIYDNTIVHEKNIYAFFIKFMQLYKIITKIKSLNLQYFYDFDDIILPDYINLEKINSYTSFYIFKKEKIPFLDKLVEIYESYTEKLNMLKKKYQCEYKIADEVFFTDTKKENFSKYFSDEKIIIKEFKNKILFTTKEVQEISLKMRMIKDQSEELISAFLNDNFSIAPTDENKFFISPLSLRKAIYNINKIQEMIILVRMRQVTPVQFTSRMIYSGPPAIYSCAQMPFNILYGNNMSGKSTYLRNIAKIILFSQTCGFSSSKISKQPIFQKLFFLREYNIFDKKNPTNYSAFEWELRKIKILIENVCENSLVLIDEIGKSGTYEEGLSIAILISKILFEKNAFSYFATHFSNLHIHLKKYEENKKFFNIIQAVNHPTYDIKSGLPTYNSIVKKIIPELDFDYENQSSIDCDINEIQFAIQLNNQ